MEMFRQTLVHIKFIAVLCSIHLHFTFSHFRTSPRDSYSEHFVSLFSDYV